MTPKRARVLWLPTHPTTGWASMLRHWRELDRVFRRLSPAAWEIRCPLGAPPEEVVAKGRFQRAWAKYVSYPWRVRLAGGADVVHVLDHAFSHLLGCAPRDARRIVTVHDLVPLEDPSLSAAQVARFRTTLSWLNRADLLLAVSEATRRALQKFLPAHRSIEVLPMGVDVATFATPRALPTAIVLPPGVPRLLSIGSVQPRKNLHLLPALLARLVRDFGPVALVRIGELLPPALRGEVEKALGPGQLVEIGVAAEELIPALYQACDVLVFPSTLEGFGLPLAEAMAAGCPVVTSNASSLPEVGRDAVLYFDPADADAAAAQIIRVLQDSNLRTELIQRGRQRAGELSWENHAARLCEFYRA